MSYSISKADAERAGQWLTRGALNELGRVFLFWFAALLAIQYGLYALGGFMHMGPSDTSDISGSERSGLRLRHDALTGCDYLETASGGLTPRLQADGRQVCK